MSRLKNIAFSALLAVGAFSAVTYTSCTKDECEDVVCNNGGFCVSGSCSCPTGYEGLSCELKSQAKFVGTYVGNETCTIGSDHYTITIAANSDALKVTMTNLYNQNITAIGTITGSTTFSFIGTDATTSSTFSGTGTLLGNELTVVYQISSPAGSNSCTFIGNK